jgi:hypothetical protein
MWRLSAGTHLPRVRGEVAAMNDETKRPSFDSDGYPTEETLECIRDWSYNDFKGLMKYCQEAWRYEEYFKEFDTEIGFLYDVHTGGWSGNESIIGAMHDNTMFWMLCWEQSRRGGHYIFKVKS